MDHDDLEIGIHRARGGAGYEVEMRFQAAHSQALVQSGPSPALLDVVDLQSIDDPEELGRALGGGLFADESARSTLVQALAAAEAADHALRMRLFLGSSVPELLALRWETLRHPVTGQLLSTSERVLFSRYIASVDFRPVRGSVRDRLRALVVVASPSDAASYRLDPVDVRAEIGRAREALAGMDVAVLASGTAADDVEGVTVLRGPVTLQSIAAAAGGRDIVVFVGHGRLLAGRPKLYVENDAGKVAVAEGEDLEARFVELSSPPRLVFLASCQSAGVAATGGHGALSALAPRLAAAGVPAVVGMLGDVPMDGAAAFAKVFFRKLAEEGRVDVAAAAARGALREKATGDAWMPVLYSRLKEGLLWADRGLFTGRGKAEFAQWPGLVAGLRRCAPILGPAMSEPFLGSRRDLARRWAEKYGYPMSPHRAQDLAEVAQFLAVTQGAVFPRDLFGAHVAAAMKGQKPPPGDPLDILARMPFPVYLTANADNLLENALRAAGREPIVDHCRWHERSAAAQPSAPTAEKPLVFHLFGLARPDENGGYPSIVISEDDYLDYLLDVTADQKSALPTVVQDALIAKGILFLGFSITEWPFRALMRLLRSFPMGGRRKNDVRAAVQVDPEESSLDPEGARAYVEQYLQLDNIVTYAGSARSFIEELSRLHAAQEAQRKPAEAAF